MHDMVALRFLIFGECCIPCPDVAVRRYFEIFCERGKKRYRCIRAEVSQKAAVPVDPDPVLSKHYAHEARYFPASRQSRRDPAVCHVHGCFCPVVPVSK